MKTILNAAFAVLTLFGGTTALMADDHGGKGGQTTDTRLKTKLAGAVIGGTTPEGSADFRADARGRARLNVEVEHVNLPAATVLTVSLQQGTVVTKLGTIKLSALGEGELELSSQDGALVPAVQKGDMVTVRNGSQTILAGAF